MNKPYKIHRNDYDNIYLSSDFHYNHTKDFLWKPRGFTSFQEHDKFIENQCESLSSNDLLIFLGDYSLNTTDEQTSALLHKKKAIIFFINGNHEAVHSRMYKNSLTNFFKGWVNVDAMNSGVSQDHASLHGANFNSDYPIQLLPFSVNKTTNVGFPGIQKKQSRNDDRVCDHIVYFGEEGYFQIGNSFFFCRHMAPLIWDKMKYDNYFAITGHSHSNLKIANPEHLDGGKILDVGVDNALKYNGSAFFRLEDVVSIMGTKKAQFFDHHGEEHV
jgi:hypothetical protein